MSKTINLDIPLNAAERVAQDDMFVCSGCGKPAPSKIKSCDCATLVGFRMRGRNIEHSLLVDPDALTPISPSPALSESDRQAALAAMKAGLSLVDGDLKIIPGNRHKKAYELLTAAIAKLTGEVA